MSFLSGLYDAIGSMSGSNASACERAEKQIEQMLREGRISPRDARAKIQEIRAKRERLLNGKEQMKEMAKAERDRERLKNKQNI